MNVEAVGEQQRRARLHVGFKALTINIGLQFVGRQHHDDVGPFGGFGHFHDLEALAFALGGGGRALAQGDDHVLHAGFAHVEHMGMALRAVADDRDLLALDEVDVGILIIIDAHFGVPYMSGRPAPAGARAPDWLIWPAKPMRKPSRRARPIRQRKFGEMGPLACLSSTSATARPAAAAPFRR